MTEFLLGLLFSCAAVAAACGLLRAEWDRTRCAYVTFEATHARLTGSRARQDLRVRLSEDAEEVRGEGSCGSARESVRLPRLEGS